MAAVMCGCCIVCQLVKRCMFSLYVLWCLFCREGFMSPAQLSRIRNTGVKMDILKQVGKSITDLPADFTPHKQVRACDW